MIVFPAPLVAGIALAAFVAGGSSTYYVVNAKRNAELVKMYRAGEKVVAKRQEKVDEYAAEVAALRERPPRIVRLCPSVPAAPGGTDAAGPPADPGRDLGPLLRETLDELLRCNALRATL